MIAIDQLKLNTTKQVSIPKARDLFARFGFTQKAGNFSGEEVIKAYSKVEACNEIDKTLEEDGD